MGHGHSVRSVSIKTIHSSVAVPISIHSHNRAVTYVRIQIQTLWITELSIGNRRRLSGPIGTHEAAGDVGVIARAKIVQLRFGVPLFASKFVVIVAGYCAHPGHNP